MPFFADKKNSEKTGQSTADLPDHTAGEAEGGERDVGKSGEPQQIYTDAHYIPLEESTDPPKYYVPAEKKDPRQATSLGTGEMIAAALRAGVRNILIGIVISIVSQVLSSSAMITSLFGIHLVWAAMASAVIIS